MKFIVDAQLPKTLSEFLVWKGYDSVHTLELSDKNKTTDNTIVENSLNENRTVISKDLDFLNSFLLKSEPNKLILVKTGNIPNKELLELFSKNLELIIEMISRSNLVEINTTDIAEHE